MATPQVRKRGWPLAQMWHKALWLAWDRLTPRQRKAYEEHYEAANTARRLQNLRGGRKGKRANAV